MDTYHGWQPQGRLGSRPARIPREQWKRAADRTLDIVESLLGKPTSVGRDYVTYGTNGSLKVFISGEHAGTFKCWEPGSGKEKGDVFDLIRQHRGLGFKQAIEYALGELPKSPMVSQIRQVRKAVLADYNRAAFCAEQLAMLRSLHGTCAELYAAQVRAIPAEALRTLERAGIVGFMPNHRARPGARPGAAFVVATTDLNGRRQGFQAIRVNPDGTRATVINEDDGKWRYFPKITCSTAAGWVSLTTWGDIILVEGPEDALTVFAARPDAMVGCAMGSLRKMVGRVPADRRIIIVAQNDRAYSDAAKGLIRACNDMVAAGHEVWICRPPEGIKDANDLLRAQGLEAVCAMIDSAALFTPVPFEDSCTDQAKLEQEDIAMLFDFDEPIREAPTRKSRLLYCAEVNALPDPDYLIEDFLPKDGVFTIYGQPGSKKGFLIVDIAMTVGALTADEVKRGIKLSWHGKEVEHGAVLYVWAEGQSGMKKRITAWRQMRQRMNVGHSVAVIDRPIDLRDSESVDALIADAAEATEALGLPVRLIVLDTLSRCSGQANINAPGEMAELVDGLERLKRETGATVIAIHHEGKDDSKGMMGATTLKGAFDAEFRVKSDDRVVTVESGKTKDDAPASFTFETRVVDVVDPVSRKPMLTRKGKQVTTLTLELAALSASSASCPSTKLSPHQTNALDALRSWLIDNKAKWMPENNWKPLMEQFGVVTEDDRRQKVYDIQAQLDAKGLIRVENGRISLGKRL